ncbi:MAG: hypothetical protein OJF59_000603 [Cytophagales bacterium]|jgi:hypothetical protein|nr:MAG: hypothetical protein OJF59_000603 [Cytophagales bacterium]
MSTIGLNSNIYHSTRVYLDLLNNFLIDANYAKEIGKPYSNEDVLEFFKNLAAKNLIDPEKQMLRSFFNRFYKEKRKDTETELANIAQHLQNSEVDTKTLKEIEALVDVLKFQCSQSYARMKGTR